MNDTQVSVWRLIGLGLWMANTSLFLGAWVCYAAGDDMGACMAMGSALSFGLGAATLTIRRYIQHQSTLLRVLLGTCDEVQASVRTIR